MYDHLVKLGVHKLYLNPQKRDHLKVLQHQISIDPICLGESGGVDLAGNTFRQIWFDAPTESLQISSQLMVECAAFNPFGFIIDPNFLASIAEIGSSKFQYNRDDQELIKPYLNHSYGQNINSQVLEIWESTKDLMPFLVALTSDIHANWNHIIREEQDLWDPGYTFSAKEGSCRDLAWMQMNMLSSLGLASRFVSGYAFNSELKSGHELHAWLEAYLPGAGWIGLDPSLGLLTDSNYIPLAVHPVPSATLPVHGTFSKNGKSTLSTLVSISKID